MYNLLYKDKTFYDAANSYLEDGGESKYLKPLLDKFGNKLLIEITPYDIRKYAMEVYPTQSNSTRNRQFLTPMRSVLSHAYDRGWVHYIKIKRFKQDRPQRKSPASLLWLHAFVRQCDKDDLSHLGTLVLFMSTTGSRVAEAVELRWKEINFADKTALLLKTKTETNSYRVLTDDVINRLLLAYRDSNPEGRVFKYTSRFSVNERIKAVCKRADIPYKSSHACGRYSFATNSISLGADPAKVMHAGGWKTSQIFFNTYVANRDSGRHVASLHNLQSYNSIL